MADENETNENGAEQSKPDRRVSLVCEKCQRKFEIEQHGISRERLCELCGVAVK